MISQRVLLFSGLSGAGKTTLALAIQKKIGVDRVSIVDGDVIRKSVSTDLGFSRTDRFENLRRMAVEALNCESEITIVAAIAPFVDARSVFFKILKPGKETSLVYLSTPLDTCEARDPKGLYQKARRREIGDFTGISSPYETPINADLVMDTTNFGVDASVEKILSELSITSVEDI